MPPDWQRLDHGPRNASWQRAKRRLSLAVTLSSRTIKLDFIPIFRVNTLGVRECTMRYDWALTSSVLCLETFRSIFAITLPLVRPNSWDAQLTVPNDSRYDRLETNLGIEQANEGYTLVTPLPSEAEHCLVDK
ncbi:hypothetical protein TNCV_2025781 [Trichonephila clavipes]|nr:hypothetical protein TNCV_2025781 [Trichonephila clavipes]